MFWHTRLGVLVYMSGCCVDDVQASAADDGPADEGADNGSGDEDVDDGAGDEDDDDGSGDEGDDHGEGADNGSGDEEGADDGAGDEDDDDGSDDGSDAEDDDDDSSGDEYDHDGSGDEGDDDGSGDEDDDDGSGDEGDDDGAGDEGDVDGSGDEGDDHDMDSGSDTEPDPVSKTSTLSSQLRKALPLLLKKRKHDCKKLEGYYNFIYACAVQFQSILHDVRAQQDPLVVYRDEYCNDVLQKQLTAFPDVDKHVRQTWDFSGLQDLADEVLDIFVELFQLPGEGAKEGSPAWIAAIQASGSATFEQIVKHEKLMRVYIKTMSKSLVNGVIPLRRGETVPRATEFYERKKNFKYLDSGTFSDI